MKNVLLVLLAILISSPSFSQQIILFNKWKVRSFSVTFGADEDRIKNLDYTYMLKTAKGVNESGFEDLNFAPEHLFSMACENPNIRLTASLDVPGLKNTELDFSVYGIVDRYDYVSYHTRNSDHDWLNDEYEYLSFNSTQNELGLESTIKKRVNLNFINLYGGLGTNLGYAFGGKMTIDGNAEQTASQNADRNLNDIVGGNYYQDYYYDEFKVRDGIQQRIYGQIGVGFIFFKRLELGIDYRRGFGYRAHFGAPVVEVDLHALSTTIRWHLK